MDKVMTERVRFFLIAREIPYYIGLKDDEQDYSCVTKPLVLDKMLATLGVESRHIICTFRWSDLSIPEQILAIPHDDEDTHEYLEVRIPETGQWVRVDPNWDSRLRDTGLPVADWDGMHDTVLAVKPLKTYPPEESARIIAKEDELDPEIRQEYLDKNREFFAAINRWLYSHRMKSL
jgi:hypothetical protein